MVEGEVGMPAYDFATFPRQFVSYKWYKPLLVFALGFIFMILFQVIVIFFSIAWTGDVSFISDYDFSYDGMDAYSGPGAFFMLGSIAVMLPALALAAFIVQDRPFSSYSSSRGGWNWAAFAKCLGVAVIIMGAIMVVDVFVLGNAEQEYVNRFTVAGAILCVVLIPLQCIAEEYVFRGFALQAISSWCKLPAVGIVASAVVFAAGHPYNGIGVVLIFCSGVIWGFVAWMTKGLEATSAAHIVNNYLSFFLSGLGVQPTTSEVDMASMVFSLLIDVIYAVAVILLGRKFNWFKSKGDGAAAFNEKKRVAMMLKEQRRLAKQGVQLPQPPYPQQAYVPQPQQVGASQPPYPQVGAPQLQQAYPQPNSLDGGEVEPSRRQQ